ncbi:MAG: ABC transporter permease [Candidatus Ozemobacteraceae bacterium]
MRDILVCASRELRRRPLRSVATVLGYAIAEGLTVLMVGILLFTQVAENKSLEAVGTHFITYAPSCGNVASLTTDEIDGLLKGVIPQQCQGLCKNCTGCNKKPLDLKNEGFVFQNTTTRLLPTSLVDHVRKIPTVADCTPYLLFRFRDSRDGTFFTVGGFDPTNPEAVGTTACAKSDLKSGAFLSTDSIGLALADEGFAFNHGLSVGDTFSIASIDFKIAGLVNTGVRPAKADVYLVFQEAEKVINRRLNNPLLHEMNLMFVQTKSPAVHDEAVEKVREIMQSNVFSSYNCYKPALAALKMKKGTVLAISFILLAGVILLSMRSQMASIAERRKEIGILKAIGWNNRVILAQVLIESTIQSFSGGFLGCLFAGILLFLIPMKFLLGIDGQLDPMVTLTVMGGGLIAAILSGLLAGIIPAFSAARQDPLDAIRHF